MMIDTKHTPGPWEISRDAVPEGYTQNTVYAERDGERVATAFRNDANARLIAAAPDLLEACKYVKQFLGDKHPEITLRKRLDAAITKAE